MKTVAVAQLTWPTYFHSTRHIVSPGPFQALCLPLCAGTEAKKEGVILGNRLQSESLMMADRNFIKVRHSSPPSDDQFGGQFRRNELSHMSHILLRNVA